MPNQPENYGAAVAEPTMDFNDPDTVAQLYETVADSREKDDFVHHEEAQGFLAEIVEQLHDTGRMTDTLATQAEQLDQIYAGRLDGGDASDYWTQFVPDETRNWQDLITAAQDA